MLLHPQFDAKALKSAKLMGKALPASPGAGTGKLAFSAKESHSQAAHLKQLIELRDDNEIKIKKLLRDKSYVNNSYFDD